MKNSIALVVTAIAASVALFAGLVMPTDAYLGMAAVVFLLVVSAIVLSVQIEKPLLGFSLLVVMGVAFPLEFRGPAGVMVSATLPLAGLLCAVWLLRVTLDRGQAALDGSRVVYAALSFIGISLLSFAVGQFPWFPSGGAPLPAQVAELGIFLLSVCLFLAVGHQLNSVTELKRLTWMLLAAGVVTTSLQVTMLPQLRVLGQFGTRPSSVGSLFWTWLVAVSFAQALFNRKMSAATRLCLLGITAIVLYHGLFQIRSWASGWVPPVAAVGVILLFRVPRLVFGLTIAAVPVGLLLSGHISRFFLGEESYSLMTRQEAWGVLWNIVERSPLLGTGPANYYYFTENFPLLGWYVRFISHNNYQDLLVQTGFLGLLAFFWFAFEAFWMMVRLYRQLPVGFAKAYVVGAIGGLMGSLVAGMLGDWIIPFYYNAGILGFRSSLLFWVFLGGTLALKRMIPSPAAVEAIDDRSVYPVQHSRRALVGAR